MEYCEMQICKSCKKELTLGATKCPYCQTYQTWYKNPQHFSWLFLIPLFIFMFWNLSIFNHKEFSEYQSDFTVTEVKIIDSDDLKAKLITYNIQNNTDYMWDWISFEVVSRNNGELLATIADTQLSWVVQPHSESLITVEVPLVPNANEWTLTIKNMKSDRY
jgi:ribosomal protein L40E